MKNQRMQPGDLCLVTGITGYVASWIGKDLLEQGYRVRGTVRSFNDQEKIHTMHELLPGVEFVEADLRSSDGWEKATKGCKWVFHVASPQAVASERDRTGGALSGTRFVLTAAFATETVEKVVVTSSEAAVAYNLPTSKTRFTEDDWTNAEGAGDYFRSKTLAEKLAWDLANDDTQNPRHIALSTISPSMILGPSLVPWVRYSHETVKNLVEGKTRMVPDMSNYFVDVRDCGSMHITLMNDPSTDWHRHLCYSVRGRTVDLALTIRNHYARLGFAPKVRTFPRFLVWMLKFFNADAASLYPLLGKETWRETKYPQVYHYRYTDLTQMVRDTIDDLLEKKAIQVKNK
ncbi:NAD-dependent epimerase/dehydratase family protein [Ktedonospora formicarum]|uniref:Aldehyde reductase n=1 Tax=Ktedonospora formicarum TaxID=2778364 RepID=A0A8J3MYC7_9CHLR|nr:NAD-dependent epimerase/dehydratase family protein [Ktedonospora formicarum]GHO50653.1 aldehyde reductase [Ktedonospora formicarum]